MSELELLFVYAEVACLPTYYSCGDGNCVRERFICDGYNDCDNGGDEQDCNWTPSFCSLVIQTMIFDLLMDMLIFYTRQYQ